MTGSCVPPGSKSTSEQQGKGRNVRVELKGVPILYAPVISFPVGDAPASPASCPRHSGHRQSGFEFGAPYYLNLAPNYDLTLTPQLLSRARRGTGLEAQFRYLSERSHGRVGSRYLPSDDLAGRDRSLSSMAPDRTSPTGCASPRAAST